jgi:hypothetical protein
VRELQLEFGGGLCKPAYRFTSSHPKLQFEDLWAAIALFDWAFYCK